MVVEADVVMAEGEGVVHVGEIYQSLISDGRLDGLVVAFASLDDHLVAQLAERGIPLVLVNRRTSGVHGSVVVDDERGSRMAIDHLVSLGHRRIGFLGLAADTDTARRRERGYRSRHGGGRSARRRALDGGRHTHRGGRPWRVRAGASRAEPPVPAGVRAHPRRIFVASLMSAIGALAAIRGAGLEVPAAGVAHRPSTITRSRSTRRRP